MHAFRNCAQNILFQKLVGVVIRSRMCKKMSSLKINWRPPSDSAPVDVSLRDTCRSRNWKPSRPSRSLRRLVHAACLLGLGIVWLQARRLKLDIFIILSSFASNMRGKRMAVAGRVASCDHVWRFLYKKCCPPWDLQLSSFEFFHLRLLRYSK